MEHTTDRVDRGIDIARALQTLDERDRAVVKLYYLYGYTQEEIGEMMGVSKMAISKRLCKIRGKLARTLAG